ncbi:MAG: hypothetical protein AAF840_16965, partial [Bacteroidota bacterium]
LTDSQGVKTSVVVPIEDWKNLYKFLEEVRYLEEVVESVKEGLTQVKKIESGEIQLSESTEDFLNGLEESL